MKLTVENSDLFFKLMMPLLAFVSRKLGLTPEIKNTVEFEKKVGFEDKAVVRDALYENIKLIDSFIDENPEDFPLNELSIVSSWKNFVSGEFFIERYLKKHAVFIGDDNKIYAVLSLRDALSDLSFICITDSRQNGSIALSRRNCV